MWVWVWVCARVQRRKDEGSAAISIGDSLRLTLCVLYLNPAAVGLRLREKGGKRVKARG